MMTKHNGSCHCGAVQIEVTLDLDAGASRCNCSICTKVSPTSLFAKPADLVVRAGEDHVASYVWGGRISTRYFCRTCGCHVFARGHLAELGGDYASVNANCLDGIELGKLEVKYWDGRHNNWEAGPRTTPWPTLASA